MSDKAFTEAVEKAQKLINSGLSYHDLLSKMQELGFKPHIEILTQLSEVAPVEIPFTVIDEK